MKTIRFTDKQIISFLKQAEAGMSIKELCRNGGALRLAALIESHP